jgi:hypothetical protein
MNDTARTARLQAALATLEEAAADPLMLAGLSPEDLTRLRRVAGEIFSPDVDLRRRISRARARGQKVAQIEREQAKLEQTTIRKLRREPIFTAPNLSPPIGFEATPVALPAPGATPDAAPELDEPHRCYICKRDFTRVHHFYDRLCPECGDFNAFKRTELADLRGRVALLTGGRVKIGYQAGLKLLRCGARLLVTTRFPRDSAERYSREPDFAEWRDRLEIFGLDLRHTPSVEAFCTHLLATRDRLDFIINNACQTVRRPPDFYTHMMERELASASTMPESARHLLGAYEDLRGSTPSTGNLSPALPLSSSPDALPGLQILLCNAAVLQTSSTLLLRDGDLLEVQVPTTTAQPPSPQQQRRARRRFAADLRLRWRRRVGRQRERRRESRQIGPQRRQRWCWPEPDRRNGRRWRCGRCRGLTGRAAAEVDRTRQLGPLGV